MIRINLCNNARCRKFEVASKAEHEKFFWIYFRSKFPKHFVNYNFWTDHEHEPSPSSFLNAKSHSVDVLNPRRHSFTLRNEVRSKKRETVEFKFNFWKVSKLLSFVSPLIKLSFLKLFLLILLFVERSQIRPLPTTFRNSSIKFNSIKFKQHRWELLSRWTWFPNTKPRKRKSFKLFVA